MKRDPQGRKSCRWRASCKQAVDEREEEGDDDSSPDVASEAEVVGILELQSPVVAVTPEMERELRSSSSLLFHVESSPEGSWPEAEMNVRKENSSCCD